jgi:hypothetical protein
VGSGDEKIGALICASIEVEKAKKKGQPTGSTCEPFGTQAGGFLLILIVKGF